jgi:hypothetical protein
MMQKPYANRPNWVNATALENTQSYLLLFFSGSGGNYIAQKPAKNNSLLTVQEQLQSLQNLGVSLSALALILRISRPTIYSWQKGSIPSSTSQKRVHDIFTLLSKFPENFLKYLEKIWLRTLVGKKSLYQLLTSDTLDNSAINKAMAACLPLIEKIQLLKSTQKKSFSQQVAEMQNIGVPILEGWDAISPVGEEIIWVPEKK